MIRENNAPAEKNPVVLGLDIGAKSIGWALIRGPESGKPTIVALGVRIFEAGVDGDIESGQDSSRAAARRMARQMRRQTFRRVQRKRKLFSLLQQAGLLPATADTLSVARDKAIKDVDARLLATLGNSYGSAGSTARKLPYVLRAEALQRPLTPEELGRAIYHFGERRGFKANRRTDRQSEDTGVVYEGIAEVQRRKGDKTLGQYFADLDPTQDRIRGCYLGRADYEDEVNRIYDAQKVHHPVLTSKFRRRLRRCLFWQRPLKSQKALIGRCSLLTNRRRCPMAHPIAQDFRLLQAVNHLSIVNADGHARVLTNDERMQLLATLRAEGDITFAQVRKLLGLKKKESRFNLEEGGEKKLPGNRTHKAMTDAVGDEWAKLSSDQQALLVGIVRGSPDAASLRGQIGKAFPSLMPHCDALDKVSLEDKPAAHCKSVLVDLLERMKDGIPYATARADFEATHNLGTPTDPVDQLPPVRTFLPGITNPAVIRALTELRKVVNEIVRVYGKPDMVRIELARDLKKPRKIRQLMAERMREREGERSGAAQTLKSAGITNPSRADVEKILLAEECGWACPYTGKSFGMADLVGTHAMVDVEHIFPRRFLDDSFANKTLCVASENRVVKKDRLPFDAYSGNETRYREILERVRAFRSDLRDEKLRRFMAEGVEEGFASRQLIDTAFASREAAKYVGLLYGGVVDVRSDKRVRTSTGKLSALLRVAWKLNTILGTAGSPKGRDIDHRHHAVDAIVIALSSDAIIKRVSDAAGRYADRSSGRWHVDVPEQEGLLEQATAEVKNIVVSHRVDRRLAGRLHKDSFYSPPRQDEDGRLFHVIRAPLIDLKPADITGGSIVDPRVRHLVQQQYAKLCGEMRKTDPKILFANAANLPTLPNRNGPEVPIKKVRLRIGVRANRIGDENHRTRYVQQDKDGLHHTSIVATREGNQESWAEHPTSRLEAQDRKRKQEPVIRVEWGVDSEFVMHLCKGDSIELDTADGKRDIYVVRGVAAGFIRVVPAWDSSETSTPDKRIRSPTSLKKRCPKPVTVTPAGRVFPRGG